MRRAAGAIAGLVALAGAGCSVVGTTVGTAGKITAAAVGAAGKLTVATVTTTGKVAAAAVTSSGDVTAGGLESAAKLSRTGMVVVVDSTTGAAAEVPWQDGLRLAAAIDSARVGDLSRAMKIYQGRHVTRLPAAGDAAGLVLQAGDVIELQ